MHDFAAPPPLLPPPRPAAAKSSVPMTSAEAQTLIPAFLDFVKTLKGEEKSAAQTFLDRLFKALGHAGAQEAGATFEYRVAKKPGSSQLSLFSGDDLAHAPKLKGGLKFADLLWPAASSSR